jgi:HSP20 family protein
MMAIVKHRPTGQDVQHKHDLLERFFDDRFDFLRWPFIFWPDEVESMRMEEFREEGSLVVRAELAGVDPDRDIEISVSDHVLHIQAERRDEQKKEGRNYVRQELRYGSISRDVPLPEKVTGEDVKATYKDGILEVRVPIPEAKGVTKVAITKY